MALTRKLLAAMGLESEKIDEIIAAHTETTDALKADRDKYKAEAEQLHDAQSELDKVKKDLEKANATIEQATKDDYKGKYESEKAAKEKLESDYKAKEMEAKENAAISKWALENGYSDEGAAKIVKYGGLRGKIKLSNDGRAEIGDDIKAELDNEWKGYKKPADVVDTAKFQKPPANDGNKSTMTKAEIMDIKDSGERQKAIAENPELFGIEKE